jgi:hypothetical protein
MRLQQGGSLTFCEADCVWFFFVFAGIVGRRPGRGMSMIYKDSYNKQFTYAIKVHYTFYEYNHSKECRMKGTFLQKCSMHFVRLVILTMSIVMASQGQGLLREYWSGITGSAVSDLTSSATYPNNPTSRNVITIFEGPTNLAEDYGTRIRGYIVPPATGNYTFWIAGDDNAELWLSTSADPAGKSLIASVPGYTNSREWTKFPAQQSSAQTLTAGQKYYVEVLHKEDVGDDNIAVGWQGPGITGDTERPIPGTRLLPYELGLLKEVWTGITGIAVSDLTSNANYPNSPTSSSKIYSFESAYNYGDDYGQRIRGYVVPPTTGSYTFWIASDDNSELWFSTSADPAGKALIASVTGYTNANEWTKFTSQQSTPVTLTAGQKYYIEALHKEGASGDHCEVGWQGPGITGEAERPIPASRLLAWTGGTQTYSLNVNSSGGGTVSPNGSSQVQSGVATAILATPDVGWIFSNWTITDGSMAIEDASSAATNVTLYSGNATVVANFEDITYRLNLVNDGFGTTTPGTGEYPMVRDQEITITATPNSGYVFSQWVVTDGVANVGDLNAASTTVSLPSGNATLKAEFSANTSNQAPIASAVSFNGTLEVGSTLTGVYTYSDAESDPEGTSTFKWYRSDDASGTGKAVITGATATTYSLVTADLSKYIQFEVTPVATAGTTSGSAVASTNQGPVVENGTGLVYAYPEDCGPGENMIVDGQIKCNSLLIHNWLLSQKGAPQTPDYVFDSNYKLPSLSDIEKYVKANGHLPEVPAAKEMEANGVDMITMNFILLKKIEEMTLLMIQQEKRIQEMEKKVDK